MKNLHIPILALLLITPISVRSEERIALFSDEALTNTTLVDSEPRVVDIYVAQLEMTGSTGCLFRIAASPGFTGVWLSDTSSWYLYGGSQTGISVSYAACLTGTAILLKVKYQLFGTSSCSNLRAAGHPVFIVDIPICDYCFGEFPVPGSSVSVNCPVATEPATWGKVKALYRN